MYRQPTTTNAHNVPGLAGGTVPQNYSLPGRRVTGRQTLGPGNTEMLHVLSSIERMGI